MKKILLICLLTSFVYADKYEIDITKLHPKCGDYIITQESTRGEILKNCHVIDTHNARVRLFRGHETVDLDTTINNKPFPISCEFKRSAVNSDGAYQKCWSTVPQADNGAAITVKSNASA